MNWKQLLALLKLRFRLTKNQARKAGKVNYYISMIFIGIAILGSLSAFVFGIVAGVLWFNETNSTVILMTWNIVALVFVFFWVVGLMAELQQTELLSLDKLLHLPISLQGAFFLNYTSCFLNTSFVLFVPGMVGLAIGMTIANGWHMAISLPLIFSFLFLISAFTYQVRGWLARLLENKKNKGNAIAVMTIFFIAVSQVPHLVTRGFNDKRNDKITELRKTLDENRNSAQVGIDAKFEFGEIGPEERQSLILQSEEEHDEQFARRRHGIKTASRAARAKSVRWFDRYCPLGWLPLGITKLAEGSLLKPVLVSLLFVGAGLASLTLSYRSNMKRYTGQDKARSKKKKVRVHDSKKQLDFLYKKVPFTSPHVQSVSLSSFRSLIRSPEAKMMLIFPVIMILVFGSVIFGLWNKGDLGTLPQLIRPWIAIGLVGGTMFTVSGLMFNIFGMDRDGFRAYILTPLSGRDLLIGKNLSLFPICGGIGLMFIVLLQFIAPVGPLNFLALVLQIPIVFIYFSLLGNYFSIGFPMGIKRGTMQPSNPKVISLIVLTLTMTLGMSLIMTPTSIVLGIPNLLELWFERSFGFLFLLLTLIQLAVSVWAYRLILDHQAGWLWSRETIILQEVANVPE